MIRRLIGFVALLVLALLALWPMRLAGLTGSGLTARAVTGSVWNGRLEAAQIKGLALGDIDAGLAPLSLASGTLRLGFAGATIRGAVLQRRGGGGVADVTGRLLPGLVAGLPIAAVDLDGISLGFADGACTAATGRITLQPGGVIASQGAFSGTPRCDGPALLLPLVSASGRGRLDLRITADGRFRAALAIDGVSEADRPALLAAGFQPTPQGLALTAEGTF
jgi:general secretion pathway protein N